jgi:hypothetical protein
MEKLDRLIEVVAWLLGFTTTELLYVLWGRHIAACPGAALLVAAMILQRRRHIRVEERR